MLAADITPIRNRTRPRFSESATHVSLYLSVSEASDGLKVARYHRIPTGRFHADDLQFYHVTSELDPREVEYDGPITFLFFCDVFCPFNSALRLFLFSELLYVAWYPVVRASKSSQLPTSMDGSRSFEESSSTLR